MEEKSNMTAERSLEIITEQIERSRQMVAKDTGLSLYVAGLCTMGMAMLIGILVYLTSNTAWYLMYYLRCRPLRKERKTESSRQFGGLDGRQDLADVRHLRTRILRVRHPV